MTELRHRIETFRSETLRFRTVNVEVLNDYIGSAEKPD